jgi:hypothetical protein
MSKDVAWAVVWLGAVWPATILLPYIVTRIRKRKVRGGAWLVFYLFYAILVFGAVIVHYNMFGPDFRPMSAHNYRGLGARASFKLTTLERWLLLGAIFSLATAFRGYTRLSETERWLLRR